MPAPNNANLRNDESKLRSLESGSIWPEYVGEATVAESWREFFVCSAKRTKYDSAYDDGI